MYDGLYGRRDYGAVGADMYERRYAAMAPRGREYPPMPPGIADRRDAFPPPPLRSPTADYERGYEMYSRRSPPSSAAMRYG